MTENMKISLMAINKWQYFMYNYPYNFIESVWGKREKFNLTDHLQEKFNALYEKKGSYGVIPAFYAELDGTNRKLLMEWVMANYNDEQKLSFKEEDDVVVEKKKIFSINISGKHGYSFAVKCDASYNEKSVINLAFAHELFMEPDDATYAVAEEITDSDYDIEGLKSATYEIL
jgi:hypothetical protein